MKHMLAFLLLPMVVTALQGSPPIRRPGTEPRASQGKALTGLLGRQSTCGTWDLCPNNDFCCPSDGDCCSQTCCFAGSQCSSQGDGCCLLSESLCGDGCCFAGDYCDQFSRCCPNGESCVEGPGGTSISTIALEPSASFQAATTRYQLFHAILRSFNFIPSASSAPNGASKLSIIMPRSGLLGIGVLMLCFTLHV
ncbi:hypothetical protein JB92DRAFT_2941126 [Gautieria morchelliformis]|nr:hypothetical protein JB92DRAFT_2941126 [Gautieria morchelliformis]